MNAHPAHGPRFDSLPRLAYVNALFIIGTIGSLIQLFGSMKAETILTATQVVGKAYRNMGVEVSVNPAAAAAAGAAAAAPTPAARR